METHNLKRHIDDDGILRIEIPVGARNTDVEIVVIVQAVSGRLNKSKSSRHERANEPWTREEEDQLLNMHYQHVPPAVMALKLKRSGRAVQARLRKHDIYIDLEES
jgi:hypothetical protein